MVESLAHARRTAQPQFLPPQLATARKSPPTRGRWLYEVKFDGYRIMAVLARGRARMCTRRGNDWSAKLRQIADELAKTKIKQAIFDGEVVAMGEDGISDFQALQQAFGREPGKGLMYFIFDVPFFQGRDLRRTPLEQRKQLLYDLFAKGALSGPHLRLSKHIEGDGAAIYEHACRMGLEGIIAKEASSTYESRRSLTWIKVKCARRQEFVIGGYTRPRGTRTAFGALLVGYHDSRGLRYAGRVGTGFDIRTLRELLARMRPLARDEPPFYDPPRGSLAREAHWIEPRLVGEVTFLEITAGGRLRAPVFKGLREDKSPVEVVLEADARLPKQRKTAGRPNIQAAQRRKG